MGLPIAVKLDAGDRGIAIRTEKLRKVVIGRRRQVGCRLGWQRAAAGGSKRSAGAASAQRKIGTERTVEFVNPQRSGRRSQAQPRRRPAPQTAAGANRRCANEPDEQRHRADEAQHERGDVARRRIDSRQSPAATRWPPPNTQFTRKWATAAHADDPAGPGAGDRPAAWPVAGANVRLLAHGRSSQANLRARRVIRNDRSLRPGASRTACGRALAPRRPAH